MDRYSHTQVDTDLSTGNLRDHFPIAMPGMHGSSCAQTLIYLCDHNENGAMGFTLNYPMSLTLADVFAQLGLPSSAPLRGHAVWAGGPAHMERGCALDSGSTSGPATLRVTPHATGTASRDSLQALGEGRGPQGFILALGYAGWTAGQLEEEIAGNACL